jgi:hypothetical protein
MLVQCVCSAIGIPYHYYIGIYGRLPHYGGQVPVATLRLTYPPMKYLLTPRMDDDAEIVARGW